MEQTVKVNKNIAQKRDSNIEFLRIVLMNYNVSLFIIYKFNFNK